MRIDHRLAAAAAAFAPLVLLAAPPAGAVGASPIMFEGDVTLPTFPCTGPGCVANFAASLAGGAGADVSVGSAVAVVTGLSATVNYSEVCAAGQAVTGHALGTATLSGVNVVGSLLPVSVPFEWTRAGLVAVITSYPMTNTQPVITGAAVFVPQGGLPTCTGGTVTATIIGKATFCFVTPEGVACVYTRNGG